RTNIVSWSLVTINVSFRTPDSATLYPKRLVTPAIGGSQLLSFVSGARSETGFCRGELPMKIVVLGAGAMGQLFGAHLVDGGHDVVMIDVSVETCKAINENGIRVDMGTHKVFGHPRAALAREIDRSVELVIV